MSTECGVFSIMQVIFHGKISKHQVTYPSGKFSNLLVLWSKTPFSSSLYFFNYWFVRRADFVTEVFLTLKTCRSNMLNAHYQTSHINFFGSDSNPCSKNTISKVITPYTFFSCESEFQTAKKPLSLCSIYSILNQWSTENQNVIQCVCL